MTDSSPTNDSRDKSFVVARPEGQLAMLPLEYRWEATRRHPYYLVFWENAGRYFRNVVPQNDEERLLWRAAALILDTIGVNAEPADPALSFSQIGAADLNPAWLSGAVQPMTLRGMVFTLLNALPPAERGAVAAVFQSSIRPEDGVVGDDARKSLQARKAMMIMSQMPGPIFDSYPDVPLCYLNPEASQRTIVGDVENLVSYWKRRRHIAERRVRTDKFRSYLTVWDSREGWDGGRYDRSREKGLTEIGQEVRMPVSTVMNQYRSAFELITGHTFSVDLWRRLFGPLKFSSLFAAASDSWSNPIRRRLQSPVGRPVPESVVSPGDVESRSGGVVRNEAVTDPATQESDLLLDIEELIRAGRTDDQIVAELELTDPALVAYLRTRLDEFGKIV